MSDIKLESLSLTNFRNLEHSNITFSKNVNCFFGDNGNGKTNLLEAIYFLSNKKSFRKNTSFSQLLSMEVEEPEILFSSTLKDVEADNLLSYSGKVHMKSAHWYLNGSIHKRKIGLKSIFINPFDSLFFHSEAAFRRKWVDDHLSLLNSSYKKNLKSYKDSLKFKNSLLINRGRGLDQQLDAIDKEVVKYAKLITRERIKFVDELNIYLGSIFQSIFCQKDELKMELDYNSVYLEDEKFSDLLRQRRNIDLINKRSGKGPHRDDYLLHFNGLNSYEFCSLGQQKMSYLGLVFAYIELFRYKLMSHPIVLIDDVSGELDKQRWNYLTDFLGRQKYQVFITTANASFQTELEKIENSKNFYISSGSIEYIH